MADTKISAFSTASDLTGMVLGGEAGGVNFGYTTALFDARYQLTDTTLTALAAYNTNGILTQTAADTFTGRTLTGTSNEVTITNGSGVSGNPTVSLPSALTFTGKTVTGGTYSGAVVTIAASGTGGASFNLSSGPSPTLPNNGDLWTNGSDLFFGAGGGTKTTVNLEQAQTFSAKKTFSTSATGAASFTVPHGTAPTSPVNGDVWTTTSGLFARINGTTYTVAGRTITGTANEITVTNGDGTAGNPTLSLPSALTFTGKTVTGGSYTGVSTFDMSTASGTAAYSTYRTTGSQRWEAGKSNTAESGSNVGSDYAINRYNDSGVYQDTPLIITRSNGAVTLNPTFFPASTTTIPSIRIPHGSAPSSPTNGDIWTTSAAGLFYRVNGATKTSADLESTQTFSGAKTFTSAATINGGMTFAAGTASVDPITLTAGTNLTTPAAGAIEYDGKVFYNTSVASSRQIVATKQIATVQGTKTALTNSITTAQSIFASGSTTLTVAAGTTYRFRGKINLNTGATTHTTAFGFGGTATFTTCNYLGSTISSAAGGIATPQQIRVAAATATVLNATSTAVQTDIWVEGIMRINAAGTIIPQVTFSAGPTGTCEVALDSFFEIEPIGSGTVVAVGNWS